MPDTPGVTGGVHRCRSPYDHAVEIEKLRDWLDGHHERVTAIVKLASLYGWNDGFTNLSRLTFLCQEKKMSADEIIARCMLLEE